jgi:hypothetical protein
MRFAAETRRLRNEDGALSCNDKRASDLGLTSTSGTSDAPVGSCQEHREYPTGAHPMPSPPSGVGDMKGNMNMVLLIITVLALAVAGYFIYDSQQNDIRIDLPDIQTGL